VTYPAPTAKAAAQWRSEAERRSPPEPDGSSEADHTVAHPVARLAAVFVLTYVALSAICIALRLLVTRASLTAGVRRWDVSVNRWLAARRTGGLDAVTAVGSHLAETPTVIGAGLVVVALLWWRRRDVFAIGILVVGLTLEVTVFVTTTLFVDRARPPVHHLDSAPPTSSFPSGHTAAAIVLYVGLIVVMLRVWGRTRATVAAAVVLALVPIVVATSRLYRGMHSPTDVLVGAALGSAALVIAVASMRAATQRTPHALAIGTADDGAAAPKARVA
jgi:membrane-associated phospholipid phosphatase